MTARLRALAAWLARRGEPAYAVIDAARAPIVYATLVRGDLVQTCLFEGRRAAELCNLAPYLVPLPPGAPLLATLAGEWWGEARAILLTSRERPADVVARLRSLLVVRTDEDRSMLFRFYDPRVLRTFLPVATPRQIAAFFGGGDVGAYVCEASEPHAMHVFTERGEGVLGEETVVLSEGAEHGLVAAR
jgi:hypothetical protein